MSFEPQLSHQTEKLQKILARAGFGSRREMEVWIRDGRIKINQRIATLGERVSSIDQIQVDGRKLGVSKSASTRQVLCYYKPANEICTRHDPKGRKTAFDSLPRPKNGRWISVGRLDLNTAGLLLLTNDGELAHRLMHPSYLVEREYAVRILGNVTDAMLKKLRDGVQLDDGTAHFKRIISAGGNGANSWYHVMLNEGRNHEVRKLWESQGVTVSRLIRIRFGPILLARNLRTGHYVELDGQAVSTLLKLVGLSINYQTSHTHQTPRI